jgi:hypothetical protein
VPQEPLDRVQVGAGLQEVRRKRMAQGVDAALLGDPRPPLGRVVELLGGGGVHGSFAPPGGEQPPGGPVLAPVGPQLLQEAGRQERVAILGPLALHHAETHPLGVDVLELEPHHLADPQARPVGGGEEGALLAGERALQQAPDFLRAQDDGEPLGLLRAWDREGGGRTAERGVGEKAEGVHGDVAGAPGEVLLSEHMDEIGLDLLGREAIGRPAIVPGQAGDGREVGLARPLGHPPHEHVVVHPHPQRGHDAPPVSAWSGDRTPTTGIHRRRFCNKGREGRTAEH